MRILFIPFISHADVYFFYSFTYIPLILFFSNHGVSMHSSYNNCTTTKYRTSISILVFTIVISPRLLNLSEISQQQFPKHKHKKKKPLTKTGTAYALTAALTDFGHYG